MASSRDIAPLFWLQESVFHETPHTIDVFIKEPLLFLVFPQRDYRFSALSFYQSNDFI
jgi:hypothetical protein